MEQIPFVHLAKNNDAKLSVVLAIYSSMTALAQELRATVERLTVASVGLVLLIDGWFLTLHTPPAPSTRAFVSIAVVIFCLLAILVIRTLHARYRGVAFVISRINKIQLAHEPGAFLENEVLFPQEWSSFGTAHWKEPIFRLSYATLAVISVFGAAAIWLF